MIDRLYCVNFSIFLEPQWTRTVPEIILQFDNQIIHAGSLQEPTEFRYCSPMLKSGDYRIKLEFCNKDDLEQILYNKDMAVKINHLIFENQTTDFRFLGNYRPTYPSHWCEENYKKGINLEPVIKSNYLGWNGTWYINFNLPIFHWIHQTTNLGWII